MAFGAPANTVFRAPDSAMDRQQKCERFQFGPEGPTRPISLPKSRPFKGRRGTPLRFVSSLDLTVIPLTDLAPTDGRGLA